MQSTKRTFIWPLVAAMAIAGGSYFGTLELGHSRPAFADTTAQTARPTPAPESDAIAVAHDFSRAFRAVHDSVENAVVNINVTKKTTLADAPQLQIPEQFRNMLPPGFNPDDLGQGQGQPQIEQGTGSGVIISADGYILTNNHVVDGATDVNVTLNDGRELKATVVGVDPKTDLAVVRVKADHLTFAKFGDSDALKPGDWVLAFGSPFGFSQTMTAGIISAMGRHVPIISEHNPGLQGMTYENFLQTDAAINPGNSGGPLVNLDGEVVGINAAIASDTGAYNGIGFSIPSNEAQYIMHSLIEHGKVVRGYLGIGIEDINHPGDRDKGLVDSIRKEGFSGSEGVLVGQVSPTGPAGEAGVQAGDVITAMNGKSFKDVDDLRNAIAMTVPNAKISLSVFRDGKTHDVSVTVGTQPDTLQTASARETPGHDRGLASEDSLGVQVQDLNADAAKRAGLSDGQGALVTQIAPNSLAANVGLQNGDVITRVDKTDITSAQQFADAWKHAKLTDGVKLTVRSADGMDHLVFVQKQ